MSDQVRLPILFAPGTEIPVTGKVEITGVPKVELNGTGNVEVINTPKVAITGVPKVELYGAPNVEITGVPKVELDGGTANVEVTNIPEVKLNGTGKVEVTNTVKVESITAGSKLKLENGAGAAGEVSVAEKRLLVTDGLKTVSVAGTASEKKLTYTAPTLASSSYYIQSIFSIWSETKVKEKTSFNWFFTIEDKTAGIILFEWEELIGERPGTGEVTVVWHVNLAPNLVYQKNWSSSGARLSLSMPIPYIRGGLGKEIVITAEVESLKASSGTLIYVSNEGTL